MVAGKDIHWEPSQEPREPWPQSCQVLTKCEYVKRLKGQPLLTSHTGKVLEYFANREQKSRPKIEPIRKFTENLMGLVKKDWTLGGEIILCGSTTENTATESSDVDLLYQLFPPDQKRVTFEHCIKPPTFKPREVDSIRPRSYFKAKLSLDPGDALKCGGCSDCKDEPLGVDPSPHHNNQTEFLDPRIMQRRFSRSVEEAIKEMCPEDTIMPQQVNGPAVTLHIKVFDENGGGCKTSKGTCRKEDSKVSKIDLSPAIPYKWGDVKETEIVVNEGRDFGLTDSEIVYLVPSGDYWKLSFPGQERKGMKKIKNVEMFRSLKVSNNSGQV